MCVYNQHKNCCPIEKVPSYNRIWNTSRVKALMEGQAEFTVVGDSAYPISRTLLKPFLAQPTQRHVRFNTSLTGLRTVCTG